MTKNVEYPFVPKSTAYMKEGHFWDIPLSNGMYACGRVLQFDYRRGKKDSRGFLAGLIDWVGTFPPTSDAISGAQLIEQGSTHIRTIANCNGAIRGFRALELDNLVPLLELNQWPVSGCWLVKGYERLRIATLEERQTLYTQSG